MKNNKICNSNSIKKILDKVRSKKKTIVLSHGVFDILHLGHIKHFESAKKNADFLVVSITSDEFVKKGPGRPIFNVDVRAKTIAALNIVDAVIISNFETAEKIINLVKPDIYFKGPDYKNHNKDYTKNILKEIKSVKKNKGKIVYSNDITYSSSNLINKSGILFNDNQKKFLQSIKKNYPFESIMKIFDKFNEIRPLILGETIIDQYIFCQVLGKSGKEPHLVIKDEYKESYLGGAGAIANHISSFCNKTDFITCYGEQNNYLNFIKKKIKKNINTKYIIKKNSPTILKKRFLDSISRNKLFGVYSMNDQVVDIKTTKNIIKNLKKFSKSNLIIISDYGHGFISEVLAKEISKINKFTALNAQVNASNYGYHSLDKYKKIDSLIINETELRHEMRDKLSDVFMLSKTLKNKYKIKNLIVTRGRNGAFLIDNRNNKVINCPAFSDKVVDKVGAGDTMLAIISLCLKLKVPSELSLFLGSLAGANAVESMGNSEILDKKNLLRKIEFILK
jgi:rfaE bifunctional protein kinase chain/domain/rfaE bifunctional protein nucleotidyltransferase chain/domain